MSRKVFVSSTIDALKAERSLARKIIQSLGLVPVMAEHDFPSQSASPQSACLGAVRAADVYVGILGPNYGYVADSSGLSATEEEFQEAAKSGLPILWFFKSGARDARQEEFARRLSTYERGFFRTEFETAEELGPLLVTALRSHVEQQHTTAKVGEALRKRLLELLGKQEVRERRATIAIMAAPIAPPTREELLALDSPAFSEFVEQRLLFGPSRLLDRQAGFASRKLSDSVEYSSADTRDRDVGVNVRVWPSCATLVRGKVVADATSIHNFFAEQVIEESKVASLIGATLCLARDICQYFSVRCDLLLDCAITEASHHYFGRFQRVQSMQMPVGSTELSDPLMASAAPYVVSEQQSPATISERITSLFRRQFDAADLLFPTQSSW